MYNSTFMELELSMVLELEESNPSKVVEKCTIPIPVS
jgi:hypothetical protein